MKRLFLIAVLSGLAFVEVGRASCNTVVQIVGSGASLCAAATCSMTFASTGSGHAIAVAALFNSSTSLTISSVSAGGTFTHCSNCHVTDASSNQTDIDYTLNSTSGATTVTVTLTGVPTSIYGVVGIEISCTGTPAFDVSGSTAVASCTSCSGQALTLTGSSDCIFQVDTPNGAASAVSSPYSTNSIFPATGDLAGAVACSQTSGAAPTWTTSSGTSAVAGMAFKDGTASSPFMMPSVR